ncbi:MAG: SDR family NAD(P)-dependent oxidoreductase [Streptosporangiaceae bacterium]
MTMQYPLGGKVAIVTGAARGIGAVVSEFLAEDGAHVALIGRSEHDLRSKAVAMDEKYPDRQSLPVRCDVTDEQQVEAMARAVADRFSGIDILVNTAGGAGPLETPAHEYPTDEFRRIMELNVVGTFLPCKYVIPYLISREGGRIVNMAGTSALRGDRNRSGYSASKWAIRGLTKTLALELGQYGITVNDVCPNVTTGERTDRIVMEKAQRIGTTPEDVYADLAGQTALGRFVDESDVAEAVRFLVSPSARNITGHDVPVDAGWDV